MCCRLTSFAQSVVLAFLLTTASFVATAECQTPKEVDAARWLPETTVLYVTIQNLGDFWKTFENAAVVKESLTLPDVKKLFESAQYRQAMIGRKFIENMFGQELPDLLQDLTAKPAVLAVDKSREVVLMFSPEPETYDRVEKSLEGFAAMTGISGENKGGALEAVKYKGVTAYKMDKVRIAFYGGRIVVASGNALGKDVLDRALGEATSSLIDAKWFAESKKLAAQLGQTSPTVSAIVDLKSIRSFSKSEIPVGTDVAQELFFGGIVDVMRSADFAALVASLDGNGLDVQAAAPMADKPDEKRAYFFGEGKIRPSPAAADLPNRLLSVRWHRDFGNFWKMVPQIITDENVLAGIAKSESEIATVFGGMTTVSDMFDFIGPELELVACQPKHDLNSSEAVPDVKLPAFGIVGTLRNSERAERVMRLAFQQFVGIANLNAGAGKYPPMELMSEKVGAAKYITASYIQMDNMMDKATDSPSSNLYANFSPTLAISGERFALSSDRALAEQLLDGSKKEASSTSGRVNNTALEVWPRELAAIGRLNREALIAQRMLESGRSRQRAEGEIDIILTIADCIQSVGLELTTDNGSLILHARADLPGKE